MKRVREALRFLGFVVEIEFPGYIELPDGTTSIKRSIDPNVNDAAIHANPIRSE